MNTTRTGLNCRFIPQRELVTQRAPYPIYSALFPPEVMKQFRKREYVSSWTEGNSAHFFIALLGSHVVGFADLMTQPDGWRLVEPLHVLPECQGQHIGARLWKACLKAAQADGAPGVRVFALRRNARAVRFFGGRPGVEEVGSGTLTIGSHVEQAVQSELDFRPLQ